VVEAEWSEVQTHSTSNRAATASKREREVKDERSLISTPASSAPNTHLDCALTRAVSTSKQDLCPLQMSETKLNPCNDMLSQSFLPEPRKRNRIQYKPIPRVVDTAWRIVVGKAPLT
jgi:hypothetical protein